ncbi:MAG TPA: hypothetical protein VF713_07810 [Thermoanaerobaculia bacterium]
MKNLTAPERAVIDVFRCANDSVEDDREAADQDVPDVFRVQRFAEREEVFELRCA